ncbi:MAG: hypothetical protein P4L42_13730 [Desulfocapsaceae bacterium]|nr:hypothetical protein [Desulfocapsaceae bacterium]
MEFISLADVVMSIQSCIQIDVKNYFKDREDRLAYRFREATRKLYNAFSVVPPSQHPTLFQYNSNLQIVTICNEPEVATNILLVALHLDKSPHTYDAEKIQSLGFDLKSIIAFLNDNGLIKHSLKVKDATLPDPTVQSEQQFPNKKTEPTSKQLSEELTRNVFVPEILQRLGYDPLKNNITAIRRLMKSIDPSRRFNLEIPPSGGKKKNRCLPEWFVLKMIESKNKNTKK